MANKAELTGKNVLLISPRFFNYEKEIVKELENKGANVHFIDDRIKNSAINKALFRLHLGGKLRKRKVFKYFDDQLKEATKKHIHYLIAIVPEGFSREIIEYYKSKLPDTVFVLYMWDSILNRPYILDVLNFFDHKYTFDRYNSEEYGLIFRPLFYTNDYSHLGAITVNFEYDLSFIGTAHSDRYTVISELVRCLKQPLRTLFFFYLQHPALILYYRLTDPKFKNVKLKDVSFKGLSKQEVLDIIKKSFCVVDINHPKQTGLTMRTLEVLGARRKLITTNKDIMNYDFYHPNNILLIDRDKPVLDEKFLALPFVDLDDSIYNSYSLSSWVNTILTI